VISTLADLVHTGYVIAGFVGFAVGLNWARGKFSSSNMVLTMLKGLVVTLLMVLAVSSALWVALGLPNWAWNPSFDLALQDFPMVVGISTILGMITAAPGFTIGYLTGVWHRKRRHG
jgi:hypothetical protein